MKKAKRVWSILIVIAMLLGTISGLGITAFADGKKDTYFVLEHDFPERTDVGNTVRYRGFLFDPEDNAVIGAEVTVACGGINASSATDDSGYFELSFIPDTVGTYSVVISFAGNDSYNPTALENYLTLTVMSRTNYNVNYEMPAAVKLGETLTVTVNVKDHNGNPISGKTVTLGFAVSKGIYQSNQAATNADGNVTLSLTTEGGNGKTNAFIWVFQTDDYFEFKEYSDIYVTDGTAYRISAKSEGSGSAGGSTVYLANETASVTATEDTLGVFQGWYENGTKVSDDNIYTFTATANRILTAHFTTVACIHEKDADYLTATPQQNASCTAPGYEAYYTCTECGKLYSDANGTSEIAEPVLIGALGHDMVHHAGVEPTCTEYGATEHYTCNRCHKLFLDEQGNIPHTDTTAIDPDPTAHCYGKSGDARFTCTRCGAVDKGLKAKAQAADRAAANKAAASFMAGVKGASSAKKVVVKWNKVPDASRYVVYATYCGLHNPYKAIKTLNGGVTACSITELGGKKLQANKHLRVYIAAQKKVNGTYVTLFKTPVFHIAGAKTAYTNVKDVKVRRDNVTLAIGKKTAIKPSLVLVNSNKKLLGHTAKFRYRSSDTSVAKVDTHGNITAVGTGECQVYVYAVNGYAKAVRVCVN